MIESASMTREGASMTGGRADEASGADRPLIGISSYREHARWGSWEAAAILLPRRYPDRVAQAGAIPVLLPPVPGVEDALERLDGLMLTGGGDIDPARYGAEREPQTAKIRGERDAAELAMLTKAISLGLPVLGICRGMQLINVARGGSLHQHLPNVVGHDEHRPGPGTYGAHEVTIARGTRLADILGPADSAGVTGAAGATGAAGRFAVVVPTHHHQAVDRLGEGLSATGWAADGTVEAMELDPGEHGFVVAVQWHPEAGEDPRLFRALVAAASARALIS